MKLHPLAPRKHALPAVAASIMTSFLVVALGAILYFVLLPPTAWLPLDDTARPADLGFMLRIDQSPQGKAIPSGALGGTALFACRASCRPRLCRQQSAGRASGRAGRRGAEAQAPLSIRRQWHRRARRPARRADCRPQGRASKSQRGA